jgi:hypothetical protein
VSFLTASSLFSRFLRDHLEAVDPFSSDVCGEKLFENESHYGLARAMVGPLDGVLAGTGGAARGRRASEIAALVRITLGLPEDIAVTVQQLACREPGCPPIETVIAVLAVPPQRWTLHRPLAEIDDDVVISLLTHGRIGDSLDRN